jgi:dienelactone hydrolase
MKKIFISKWFIISVGLLALIVGYIMYNLSFKGNVERITFESNGIEIESVIITPDGPGPHPGIVLLAGSGSSHQEYDKVGIRIHANYFLSRGFAVFSYTKRGSGNNGVNYSHVTFQDLITDALAAVATFRNHPKVDADNIGLRAVSESGWFAPEVAFRDGNIKFIINRVSPPIPWMDVVTHEVKVELQNSGFTNDEIDNELIPLTRRIWQFYIDAEKNNDAVESERIAIEDKIAEMDSREKRFKDYYRGYKLAAYDADTYKARASKYSYNPQPYLNKINIPMLYLFGGVDQNIPTEECVAFLNALKQTYKNEITIKVFQDADHYMYQNNSFPVEGFYQKGYIETQGDWAIKQVK